MGTICRRGHSSTLHKSYKEKLQNFEPGEHRGLGIHSESKNRQTIMKLVEVPRTFRAFAQTLRACYKCKLWWSSLLIVLITGLEFGPHSHSAEEAPHLAASFLSLSLQPAKRKYLWAITQGVQFDGNFPHRSRGDFLMSITLETDVLCHTSILRQQV